MSEARLSPEQVTAMKALVTFLKRPDIHLIKTIPHRMLTPNQRDLLQEICTTFARPRDAPGGGSAGARIDDAAAAGTNRSNPKRNHRAGQGAESGRSTKKSRNNAMSRFSLMEELPELDACIDRFVTANGADAAAFMGDFGLELGYSRLDEDHNFSDAFVVLYQYVTKIQNRTTMDHIRFLFVVMNMYAVVGLLNPETSQHHLTDGVADEVMRFIATAFKGNEVEIQAARQNIRQWNKWGKRLVALCDTFGEGAIFLLHHHLSPDFLENKFRLDGEHHAEAFKTLDYLGLTRAGEETMTTELGANIRAMLIEPFEDRLDTIF